MLSASTSLHLFPAAPWPILYPQVRAANLSGDCGLWQELLRGNLPANPLAWRAQQRACVARRAALSVALNPGCGGAAGAREAVAAVMGRCLADVAPFQPGSGVAT